MAVSLAFFGLLVVGLGSLAVAVTSGQRRTGALWLATASLAAAGALAIFSVGIFLLIVPICTGFAAVSSARRRDGK